MQRIGRTRLAVVLVVAGVTLGSVASSTPASAAAKAKAKAKASARVANGTCLRTELNVRTTAANGQGLVCQRAGATYRWRVSGPKHGDPCTQRGANSPGTALDCVVVPGNRLQWRLRGTVRNPFRLGEAAEAYSFEGSRYRIVLTDWNPDLTPQNPDLAVPGVAFVAWRFQSTLLASGGPGKVNRTSEASIPFAYVVTDQTREDQTIGLSDGRKPGSQPDLPACRDGRIQLGFPAPAANLKDRLETLQVGESGYDEWCKEAPAGQSVNVVLESNSWFTQPRLEAQFAISVYFSGNPR